MKEAVPIVVILSAWNKYLIYYLLLHGFLNYSKHATTGTTTIVYWYAALIKKLEI